MNESDCVGVRDMVESKITTEMRLLSHGASDGHIAI